MEATGYGIVMPTVSELKLEQPQIVRQGTNYGVRLEACAPSIQMMKATIHTELSPIVGTEKQSEDLVQSLLADFADDPVQLWESNISAKAARAGERWFAEQVAPHPAGSPHPPAGNAGTGYQRWLHRIDLYSAVTSQKPLGRSVYICDRVAFCLCQGLPY